MCPLTLIPNFSWIFDDLYQPRFQVCTHVGSGLAASNALQQLSTPVGFSDHNRCERIALGQE
jgi:hypothetical protein